MLSIECCRWNQLLRLVRQMYCGRRSNLLSFRCRSQRVHLDLCHRPHWYYSYWHLYCEIVTPLSSVMASNYCSVFSKAIVTDRKGDGFDSSSTSDAECHLTRLGWYLELSYCVALKRMMLCQICVVFECSSARKTLIVFKFGCCQACSNLVHSACWAYQESL